MAETFWNNVFSKTDFHYGTQANDWIETAIGRYVLNGQWFANLGVDLPDELRIIELAAGEGRNAVWLAEQGFDVTAFDQSGVGLEKAQRLAREHGVVITTRTDDVLELAADGEGWYAQSDIVVSTFFHVPPERKRELFRAHRVLVRPGGLVIAEWFHPEQRTGGYTSGGPPNVDMLITVPELRTAFAQWHILECRQRERELDEGAGHTGPGVVTQLVAQRPMF